MPAALIVIDVQQSFLHRPYWSDEDLPAFRAALVKLIAGCRARAVPVVHVLHEDGEWPFDAASGLVQPLDWLPAEADATFIKHVHNALTGSGLAGWLAARGIDTLLIAGIRTEQCCETTARVAADLGYRVDFVSEATLTFAMQDAHGRTVSAAAIKAHTELVLAGRFAAIRDVDATLAALDEQEAAACP
ncbi:isochorismatase family protein [Crenobacter caeni]|uniref:Isochorismatase family protein n=1 Tax=Crenobacter caeni TaxID=2705474 RepID=A0A6B2KNF1_9NEIS|nr:isochorismatase family protein [Crenobacter caeni]NDV11762.1 isochorismatase family protein [Crenobacter caeni]